MEYTPSDFDDNPFRYCGEYFDKETQTIYLRARYYDANQGRFTQEDPIRDGDNWYSYCGGNPIMFVDPTGLWFWFNIPTKKTIFDLSANSFNGFCNYIRNRILYSKLEYINGQAIHPQVSQCKFGLQYMSKNGCGPIAIYNAMIGCLEPQQLADIVAYCEQQGGAVLGGFLGMDSSVVAEYFKSQGFITETTTSLGAADVLLREYGHAVLLQWNDADDIFKGQHYVYIRYEDNGTITVYNEYSDANKPQNYKSIEDYITSQEYVLIEATFIYGPKKI